MKTASRNLLTALLLTSVMAMPIRAQAVMFTWTRLLSGSASGSWGTQSFWTGGVLPTSTSDGANFSTLDVSTDSTISLDGNRAINSLSFGDTNATTAANWFLAPGTPASSTLTLGGVSPSISVSGLASGKSAMIATVIAGTNGLVKSGNGYLALNAANTYGGTTVLAPSGGNGGISCGHDFSFGTSKVQIGSIVGDSQAWFQSGGSRTLTNSFEIRTVRWIIDSIQVGTNPAGDLTINGPVSLNQGAVNVRDIYCLKNLTLGGPMTSTGGLNKNGPAVLTLNGTNTSPGGTTINSGTIRINKLLTSSGTVSVLNGCVLGGTGVISGTVSIQDGGTLQPGLVGSGILTVGTLTTTSNASLSFGLGTPGGITNGFIRVNGNLTLAGRLNISDLGGFTSGSYTGISYSGTLNSLRLVPDQVPPGKSVSIRTNIPHYVVFQVASGYFQPPQAQVVPMDQADPLTLMWPRELGTTAHDLYFATSSNAVFLATTNSQGIWLGRTTTQTYNLDGIAPNTTYYWRADGIALDGTISPGAVMTFTTGSPMVDLMQDTWVATDGLGRTTPGNKECGSPRTNRPIGVFYFLWHNYPGYGSTTNWDVSRWIAAHPYTNPLNPWADNPIFQQVSATYYWGEPAAGYYLPNDPWVLRRQIALLTHAGVDVLIMDYSNAVTYDTQLYALCDMIRKMRSEGFKTNLKIVFLTHAGSAATITYLYNTFYAPNKYPDLWYYWHGKPLILGYINGLDATDPAPPAAIQNFFTWRQSWAWEGGLDKMAWIDSKTPQQFGYHDSPDHPESTPVTIGGWSSSNIGHSYTNHTQPAYDRLHLPVGGTQDKGLFFAEQMNFGLKLDPDFLFITGWNEWIAGAFQSPSAGAVYMLGQPCPANGFYFVDEYNQEYNRDIEPMKGGYTDNYYFQMVGQNRQRKGARPVPAGGPPQTINVGGDFSDWTNVTTSFFDPANDTIPRNFASSVQQNGIYTNTSGRNDFTLLKVARDESYLYFFAQCRSNITSRTGSNWMVLFIDADQNHATGWEGYDYALNLNGVGATTTTLARNTTTTNGWIWSTLGSNIPFKVSGNTFMLRLARSDLGLGADPIGFDFHWVDNFQAAGDIADFGINGDSAPDRRFNYRYQTVQQGQRVLARDDFDGGRQTAWLGAWSTGSRWDLTGNTFYSSNRCAECNIGHGTGNGLLQMQLDPSPCSSLRISFRYKLHGVNNASGVTLSYLGTNGWVKIRNLGRDEYYPTGQAWGYDERQDVWLQFTDLRPNSGTNTQFFTNGFTFKIDATTLSNGQQSIWIDDFLATGTSIDQATSTNPVVVKANNTTALVYGQSWVGGLPPGESSIATWDSTVTSPNSTLLGADTLWSGLQILNPSGPVTISGATTLGLGTDGIKMGTATQSLTINHNISLVATQSWNVNGITKLTVNGAIGGAGDLNKEGAGSLTLAGGNTFKGNINLNGGTLSMTNGESVPDTSTITLANTSGVLLKLDGSETIGNLAGAGPLGGSLNIGANNLTLGGNDQDGTFSGQITGTGSITKNGAGTLTLNAVNNFAGAWQINGGIVRISNGNALGQGGFSAATWTLVGNNAALELSGNLSLAEHMHILGNGPDANGALRCISGIASLNQHIALDGDSTINVAAGASLSQTFQFYNGVGPCTLRKTGTGDLTVGSFVFPNVLVASGRFINNGTIQANAVVAEGGTLAGTGVITGSLTVSNGGCLSPGNRIGTLTVGGSVVLAGSCLMELQKTGNTSANDQLSCGGKLVCGGTLSVTNLGGDLSSGGTFKLFSATNYAGQFTKIVLPLLPRQLYWETQRLLIDGTITVLPIPGISVQTNSHSFRLSWPSNLSGWQLQGQTNSPGSGLTTNWFGVGGVVSNAILIPIVQTNGSSFFRLSK